MQAIDLFSGAGGMSVGAYMCGIKVKYAVELDQNAARTFTMNHTNVAMINRDVRSVDPSHFKMLHRQEEVVMFGGPPCQGFSTSNQKNRDLNNPNNWLFQEYLRLVREIRPDWVVFENVKGLLETENGYFLDAVIRGFKKFGYTTSHFVLNSADYGVPQKRNRLFILGSLHGSKVNIPSRSKSRSVTVMEAFYDLPHLENGDIRGEAKYRCAARSKFAISLRGALKKCHNNVVTLNAPHIIERYGHIPQGGNWEDIPEHLMRNYTDRTRCHTGIYRRLNENEPAVVIGNFRKNMLIHPWQDRGLSVREAARLQSFPDSFRFAGSIGFQQQQVANAVPPLLAKAVFSQIIRS